MRARRWARSSRCTPGGVPPMPLPQTGCGGAVGIRSVLGRQLTCCDLTQKSFLAGGAEEGASLGASNAHSSYVIQGRAVIVPVNRGEIQRDRPRKMLSVFAGVLRVPERPVRLGLY